MLSSDAAVQIPVAELRLCPGSGQTSSATMVSFFSALSVLCAGTLMYEIVLTRLLSVTSWYYMAFVSISMAMFGMTAGALSVQLFPNYFSKDAIPRRLTQAALRAAISLPVCLIAMSGSRGFGSDTFQFSPVFVHRRHAFLLFWHGGLSLAHSNPIPDRPRLLC